MEEQQNKNKRVVLSVCLSLVASVLLASTSIGSLIYTVPLIIISYSFRDTVKAVLAQLAAVVAVAAMFIYDYRGLFQKANLGIIIYAGYLMILPGVFCIIYTALRDFTSSVMRRIVDSSFAVLALGTVFILWLKSTSGAVPYEGLSAAFNVTLKQFPVMEEAFDVYTLTQIVTQVFMFSMVPVCLVFCVLPVLLAEAAFHKLDANWQSQFAFMKMPSYYAYILIGILAGAVLVSVLNVSEALILVLWNAFFWLSLHYLLNGMSLYAFWRRKSNPYFTASRVVILVFLVNLIPGVGLFVSCAFVIFGILETWIEFR